MTAVEWLIDQMFRQGYFDGNKPLSITNLDHLQHQAKEMENERVCDITDEIDFKLAQIEDYAHVEVGNSTTWFRMEKLNTMTEHFLTYEQSLAVKELGFDEPCMGWYASDKSFYTDNKITIESGLLLAPLKSQFFKWVRDKGYKFNILNDVCELNGLYYFDVWLSGQVLCETDYIFETYEQAEDACINKIIELLKLK